MAKAKKGESGQGVTIFAFFVTPQRFPECGALWGWVLIRDIPVSVPQRLLTEKRFPLLFAASRQKFSCPCGNRPGRFRTGSHMVHKLADNWNWKAHLVGCRIGRMNFHTQNQPSPNDPNYPSSRILPAHWDPKRCRSGTSIPFHPMFFHECVPDARVDPGGSLHFDCLCYKTTMTT